MCGTVFKVTEVVILELAVDVGLLKWLRTTCAGGILHEMESEVETDQAAAPSEDVIVKDKKKKAQQYVAICMG